jgi:hypothetical protein
MITVLLSAGLALALALLIAIHRRLSGLPLAVWALARREREANATKALDAMKEEVAARAGLAVVAIRRYEEQIGATFRAQVAEAETRARMAERRAADAATALEAAAVLVRELRLVLGVVGETVESAPKRGGRLPSAEEPDDEDERTRVSERADVRPGPGGADRG